MMYVRCTAITPIPRKQINTLQLSYIGLPAAGVLSKELLRQSHTHSISPSFPRGEVIQNLTIFAAHLETFFPDREGDHETRTRGLWFIRSVLDAVLSPQNTGTVSISQPESSNDLIPAVQLPGPPVTTAQPEPHALDERELDFAALWEDIDFDWDGDRRVFLS